MKILIAGVVGHPLSHSLSPSIFSFLSRSLKTPTHYQKFEISPEHLISQVQTIKRLSLLTGWNVTLPYKSTLCKLMDQLSPEAAATQAVNVVKLSDGKLTGFNTDVFGIAETFKESQIKVKGKSVLLFGAGGAATAAAYVLGQKGARSVWITNRTQTKSLRLARALRKQFPQTDFRPLPFNRVQSFKENMALYINATPLGMSHTPLPPPLPEHLSPGAIGFDLIYRPRKTPFLNSIRSRGLKGIDGLDMLIWQAMASWEIWVGKIPQKKKMKKKIKASLERLLMKEEN